MNGSLSNRPLEVDQAFQQYAQQLAETMLHDVIAIKAVVVATADGFDIASAIQPTFDASRIAALASSIAAIGDVVAREAELGTVRSVTVDTDAGIAMIFSIRRAGVHLVINVISDDRVLLGELAYRTATLARLLGSGLPA